MNTFVLIMAGGRGERFWPKSRISMPKQFLSLSIDGHSMIQNTIARVSSIVDIENIFVMTNESYSEIVKKQIPTLPSENILLEPVARNTAACVAVGAALIEKKYGNSVMIVLPSDHLVLDTDSFIKDIRSGIEKAIQGDHLVTLGIKPLYSETGYGYIKYDKSNKVNNVFRVEKFVEKPSIDKASQYIAEGNYLWNSGIFIWQTSTILERFRSLMPELYSITKIIQDSYLTDRFMEVLKLEFPKMPSESVDYGIMEKSKNIFTVVSDFGWDDMGSWPALERHYELDSSGNISVGETVLLDTHRSIIVGNKKLIATLGVEDIIVIDTDDAMLICHKRDAQNIKKIISRLKEENKCRYL